MRTKKLLLAGITGFGLLLAACNGGDDAAAVPEGDLIGKWILKNFHSEGYMKHSFFGTPQTIPLDTTETYTDNTYYYDFKADHTFTANTPDTGPDIGVQKAAVMAAADLETGTWSLSGNTLTTISSGVGSSEKDTLSIKVAINGADGVFSYHIDEKDSNFEIMLDATANARKSPTP